MTPEQALSRDRPVAGVVRSTQELVSAASLYPTVRPERSCEAVVVVCKDVKCVDVSSVGV